MKILMLLSFTLFAAGCSSMSVEPWERDLLAQDSMQLVPDYMDNYFDEHIYSARKPRPVARV